MAPKKQSKSKPGTMGRVQGYFSTLNKAWIILGAITMGLLVFTTATGGVNENETIEIYNFKCQQTPNNELLLLDESPLNTDFDISTVAVDTEIYDLEVAKNEVKAISDPKTISYEEADQCMEQDTEVLVVVQGDKVRVYPYKILNKHLIVNDTLGGLPILITYCGLCDSYQVYLREYNNEIMQFGYSGMLYKNSGLLFDTKTESLWSPFSGDAIVGDLSGASLTKLPSTIMGYEAAKLNYPNADFLSYDTGFRQNYTRDSYEGYAVSEEPVIPVQNKSADFDPKELIVGFTYKNKQYATAKAILDSEKVVSKLDDGKRLVIKIHNSQVQLKIDHKVSDIPIEQAYWYVWYDYYPDTRIIK
ncbi:MAG: DUF3179 domain-containing (seleno)protein [Candidatus Dojkabacteria bacterium]